MNEQGFSKKEIAARNSKYDALNWDQGKAIENADLYTFESLKRSSSILEIAKTLGFSETPEMAEIWKNFHKEKPEGQEVIDQATEYIKLVEELVVDDDGMKTHLALQLFYFALYASDHCPRVQDSLDEVLDGGSHGNGIVDAARYYDQKNGTDTTSKLEIIIAKFYP
jgi:hypothetical protein